MVLDHPRTAVSIVCAAVLLGTVAHAQELFGIAREMVPVEAGAIVGAADFDGDGDQDLLGYSTGVWLNDGHGRFSPHPTPSNVTGTGPIAIADFNGDGLPDVVRGTSVVTTTLAAWVSIGGGVLLQQAGLLPALAGATPIACLAAGDVDGDGDRDLVIGRAGGPPVLWMNLGPMSFVDASIQLPPGSLSPFQAQLIDLDGDGDRDLLIAVVNSFPPTNGIVMTNDGTGVFTTSPSLLGAGLNSFTTGDVNGDQLPDIASFTAGQSAGVTLFVNNGPGLPFSPPANVGFGIPLLVDVDNDGADELLLAHGGLGVQLFSVSPGPAVSAPFQTLGVFATGSPIIAGDFDGDGDEDAILPAAQAYRLLLNTGQGLAVVPGILATPVTGARVFAGDFEGDGDVDLIAAYPGGIGIARNDGNGQLDWESSLQGGIPGAMSFGNNVVAHPFDADGDGDLDLYVAEPASLSPVGDRMLLNTGTGFTATIPWSSAGTTIARAIQSGDVDGDGDRDLVVGRWQTTGTTASPMPTQVFLNTGAGTFAPPAPLPVVNWSSDLALVDVDADGDLDLVQTAYLWGTIATSVLMLNDGSGIFTQATGFPGTAASYVATGDLDGDGDPDLLLDRHVLLNDGSGAFTAGPVLAFPGNPTRPVLVDADDDGDLDVLEAGWLSVSGGGSFAFPFLVAPIVVSSAGSWAAVADFDRDGDQDLVVPSPNPRLYSGFARQLTRGNPARPGRPASFDLRGPSLGTWTLFVSTGPAAIPLPPFGTVWIDPAPAIALGSGQLDTVGRGTWSIQVPTSPSFVGQSFFLQAVVFGGAVPKLTGREIATVATY